ncbi:EAL domain-containing protein [Amphritea sp. HPY]|uniref:sensor domain-containing protein n=1 Tax=Amphritea sp. HPY TaxID=3421652 RepID=UPI003D7CA53A
MATFNLFNDIKISMIEKIITICLILLAIFVTIPLTNIRDQNLLITDAWRTFDRNSSDKAHALKSLRRELGYGGMIHHFKNHLLRDNEQYFENFLIKFGGVKSSIKIYLSQNINSEEIAAIKEIEAIIDQYYQASIQLKRYRISGLTVQQTDKLIKIDDRPALHALRVLESYLDQTSIKESKIGLLNNLHASLGYGGMIQYFKDYILRQQLQLAQATEEYLDASRAIIKRYKIYPLTQQEIQSLNNISKTLDLYEKYLYKVQNLISQGKRVEDIDMLVVIDDAQTLKELINLTRAISLQSDTETREVRDQLTIMVRFIDMNIISNVILLALIISLFLWLINVQILRPLLSISGVLSSMTNVELDVLLTNTKKKNELFIIAKATEAFRNYVYELEEAKNRLEKIFKHSPHTLIMVNKEGDIVSVSLRTIEMFGYSHEELIGCPLESLLPKRIRNQHQKDRVHFYQNSCSRTMGANKKLTALHKDNYKFPVDIEFSHISINEEEYVLASIINITEHNKNQKELIKLSTLVENSPNIIIVSDLQYTIEYANKKFLEVTGFHQNDIIGKGLDKLISDKNSESITLERHQALQNQLEWHGDLLYNKKDNTSNYWVSEIIFPITSGNNSTTHFACIAQDITNSRKIIEEMNFQASHDDMTGLLNRNEFNKKLKKVINRLKTVPDQHALCYLDLDQFKNINDTLGHMAGDELLKRIAFILKETIRDTDFIARLGGDEFGIYLENCNQKDALVICNKIRHSIENYRFLWHKKLYTISASIGISCIDNCIITLEELMDQADTACYTAKLSGRNTVHLFNSSDNRMLQHEISWVPKINDALLENNFLLYLQPIKSSNTSHNEFTRFEVLVRMYGENNKIISPGSFLPTAERFGLAKKIDQWVLNKLFNLLENTQIDHIDSIAINLSGLSISDQEFCQSLINSLHDVQFPTNILCFEITETAAIHNIENAKKLFYSLHQLDCSVALDDFGSGISSYGYLQNLKVDYIKIDGIFVRSIDSNNINLAIVTMINNIGKITKTKTIAEFVENEKIAGILCELGVDYLQGYHISKPLPFAELIATSQHENESISL